MRRKQVSSGAVWEDVVGYSRAIRVGNIIEVAGTTAVNDDGIVAPNDPIGQTRFILSKISLALQELDATLDHVVRTRIFVTDISHWQQIGKVHGEFFSRVKPVATMVEVSRLIEPELMVEIEVSAIIEE